MSCLISICPKSLYFAFTFEECFCWVYNSRLVVICFSAFYRCQSIIFWLPCSWKVSYQCCCATKSHTFFPLSAWTCCSCLRHLQSCWNQCVVSFLSQWSDSWTNSCHCPCQSVQSLSIWPIATPWTAAHQASLSITNSRACSGSWPSSHWCHPTISSSVVPFSSCLQSSPASGSFPISQSFTSGGQNIGALASVFAVNVQVWFALGVTCWISTGLSRVFSNSPVQKHRFFGVQPSSWGNSHIHTWLLEKP